jgi:hypothetical protein
MGNICSAPSEFLRGFGRSSVDPQTDYIDKMIVEADNKGRQRLQSEGNLTEEQIRAATNIRDEIQRKKLLFNFKSEKSLRLRIENLNHLDNFEYKEAAFRKKLLNAKTEVNRAKSIYQLEIEGNTVKEDPFQESAESEGSRKGSQGRPAGMTLRKANTMFDQ